MLVIIFPLHVLGKQKHETRSNFWKSQGSGSPQWSRKLRGLYWDFPKVAGCKLNSFPVEEVMNCLHSLALIWPHILSEISLSHPPLLLPDYSLWCSAFSLFMASSWLSQSVMLYLLSPPWLLHDNTEPVTLYTLSPSPWTLHGYTQSVRLHSNLFCGHREPINFHACPLRQRRETYLSQSIGTNRTLLKSSDNFKN